jgi:5-methyltetrahydrofolate--homocysteine methyltransferase
LFAIVRRCREELGVNTCCGASNISFGLPDRPTLNGAFLAMAIAAGMTCAITNPIEPEIKKMILAANVYMGHDENCMDWLTYARSQQAAAAAGGAPAAGGAAATAAANAAAANTAAADRAARREARRNTRSE